MYLTKINFALFIQFLNQICLLALMQGPNPNISGPLSSDFSSRPHKGSRHHVEKSSGGVDRFTSLPDELVIRILSVLPTKDAAATTVLSSKMKRIFPWITTLDFEDSHVSHCLNRHPIQSERFQNFNMFVDGVLEASQSPQLSRYRLHFGSNIQDRYLSSSRRCPADCLPAITTTNLNAWICFPLARGIREIDLCIVVRDPGELPPALFSCGTLQVLKLEVNLDLAQVCATECFHLPSLKVFHLKCVLIPENSFLTRLVSSCPVLEEVALRGWLEQDEFLTISSRSLQRLLLNIYDPDGDVQSIGAVCIDTPNLQSFFYFNDLAYRYSFTSMNALVEAMFDIDSLLYGLDGESPEASFASMLCLVRAVYNVQRLSLTFACIEALNLGKIKDQLPLFSNLRHLEVTQRLTRQNWTEAWLEILYRSPVLETLDFSLGFGLVPLSTRDSDYRKVSELEHQLFETVQVIPSCCRSHLKRIVIGRYYGLDRELEMVKFILRISSVLEELVITITSEVDQMLLESTLKTLPRASMACSIHVSLRNYTKAPFGTFSWKTIFR